MALRVALLTLCATLAGLGPASADSVYPLTVLPPEHKTITDPLTGAQLLFVTTHPAEDRALYFHQRSFLADNSAVIFHSWRPDGGLFAYLFATGELVRLVGPEGRPMGPTAARDGSRILGYIGRKVIEWTLDVQLSPDLSAAPSKATATERVIATLPDFMGPHMEVNENSDGTLLAVPVDLNDKPQPDRGIAIVNIRTGDVRLLRGIWHAGHIQFSRQSPYLLSYAGMKERLWVIDLRDGEPRLIHPEAPRELVAHECWWINDTLTFCGGYRKGESHVKVIDPRTGEVRIVGPGVWVPWRDPGDDVLNRWNWWHAAGYQGGAWIVADNWYGDLVLFDGHTTQMRRLTLGHRKYGLGQHPEPGWDRTGRKIVFSSQMLGPSDVCVATIPDSWQPDAADEGFFVQSLSRQW